MYIPNRQPSEQPKTAHAANYLVENVPLIVCHPCSQTCAQEVQNCHPPHDWASLYPFDFGVPGDRFVNSETDSENNASHYRCAADRGDTVINRNWESIRHCVGRNCSCSLRSGWCCPACRGGAGAGRHPWRWLPNFQRIYLFLTRNCWSSSVSSFCFFRR